MQYVSSKIKKFSNVASVIVLLVLFFLLGYAGGRAYKTYEIHMEKHMQNQHAQEHTKAHKHDEKELVNPKYYAPKILKLTASKDSESGYNLKIDTAYFRFTPENTGGAVTQNTGHAHVYVNSTKVGRVYGPWYHIPEKFFQNGTNTISVTLNANNHNTWWSKNGTEEARASIEVVK